MAKQSKGKKGKQAKIDPVHQPVDKEVLREFVYFCIGDPRLTAWEANFVNSMNGKLNFQFPVLTAKQLLVFDQIKEKLDFTNKDKPIPEINLVTESDDPDGYDMDADGFIIRPEEGEDEFNCHHDIQEELLVERNERTS